MDSQYLVPEPVFVVGMNGSGTTMLLDSLGRHPQLYAFPKETRLIPWLISRESEFGDLQNDESFYKLWSEVAALPVFRQANDGNTAPIPEDWQQYPRSLAAVLDGVFSNFARGEGKTRWCEKTPQHVQHILALAERFPGAKFIHMVRDGRDCAVSFNRRWHRTPELTMYRWKKVISNGREQGLALGDSRYLEIRYEDLTREPEQWLQQVCSFLDINFVPAVLESSQPYLQTDGRAGGLRPNSGKWQGYFNTGTNKSLEKIGGKTLNAFGYPADYPDSDENLSGLQRKLYSAKDSLVQYGREILLKLSGRVDRPWRVILSKPFVAVRQRGQNRY